MTVIDLDLDLDRPAAQSSARPPMSARRPAGLALAAVLALALGGAAPAAPALWHGLGTITLAADDLYAVDEGHVLTVESPQERPRLSAWGTDPVRRLWTTELDPGVPPVLMNVYGARLTIAGDRVLAQSQDFRTTAVGLGTGRKLWESPVPVVPAAPGVGLARTETYPPGSETEGDGSGGGIYISTTGVQYHEPPLTTDLAGIDLATGRTRWTRHHTGSASATPVGPRLLEVAKNRLRLLDPANGRVLAERAPAEIFGIDIVDGLVLVAEARRTVAYDGRTLEPRWRAPQSRTDEYLNPGLCQGLICRKSAAGVQVLDPATGRTRWTTAAGPALRRDGPAVVEMEETSRRPLRLLDPATGEVRAPLAAWQMVTQIGDILLSRPDRAGRRRPGLYADYTAAHLMYLSRGYRPDGRGLACRGTPVEPGAPVRVDTDLALMMTTRVDRRIVRHRE